ncbi:hypothetical protein A1F94_000001, partial [Pyrenophora tritici-repentis]
MPAKRTRVNALEIATTSKRPRVAARHRGTASQPVLVDTRPFSPSPPPPPLDLRESRAEETIIPPPEGSEHATVAASGAASEAVDEGFVWVEDKYDGFNWSRYPKHCKPPTSLSNRASWVYSHSYRIALRSNVAKVTWICHYCYKHKFTTVGRGIHDVSQSPSAPARHLGEDKKGHGLKPQVSALPSLLGKKLSSNAPFRRAALRLLPTSLPTSIYKSLGLRPSPGSSKTTSLSQFESSSFRNMIQLASVEAERALWASHNSVSRYVIRLYNYLLPKVVASLSESMSKVHISFDGWTTKLWRAQGLAYCAPTTDRCHTGEAMAEVVMAIFKQFEITVGKLGYFVLDNAHNNNTTINTLALQMGFSATERRLRCGPHTLNLIGQMLLWGEEKESYDNEETERCFAVINYIKHHNTQNQEPVKPVVTRWNSYVSCFERAVELQLAVNGYANHIQKIETEDAYEDVIHDEHRVTKTTLLSTSRCLVKAREYYNKLDLSPAYYAATSFIATKATLTQ